jgi:hypothetical protein
VGLWIAQVAHQQSDAGVIGWHRCELRCIPQPEQQLGIRFTEQQCCDVLTDAA